MYVGVAITVGRDLEGNLVGTNSSDLPVNLYVGNLGAYQFVGMEGTSLPVRAAPSYFEQKGVSLLFFAPRFTQLSLHFSIFR